MNKIFHPAVHVVAAALAVVSLSASADQAVGGDETNVDRVVPFNNAWTILVSEPFVTQVPGHCIATGSADAENPAAIVGDERYRFVLSMDDPNPPVDTACERTAAFDNNAVQSVEEVSSTCTFRNVAPGFHRIFWLARRGAATSPNLVVRDNSMTFVCQNQLLDADGLGDGI